MCLDIFCWHLHRRIKIGGKVISKSMPAKNIKHNYLYFESSYRNPCSLQKCNFLFKTCPLGKSAKWVRV